MREFIEQIAHRRTRSRAFTVTPRVHESRGARALQPRAARSTFVPVQEQLAS